jgi:hypothetical protein
MDLRAILYPNARTFRPWMPVVDDDDDDDDDLDAAG